MLVQPRSDHSLLPSSSETWGSLDQGKLCEDARPILEAILKVIEPIEDEAQYLTEADGLDPESLILHQHKTGRPALSAERPILIS